MTVKIELYKGGVYVSEIVDSVRVDEGYYKWAIHYNTIPGTDYQIKITSTSVAGITDISDGYFEITRGVLTVVSPNGGEKWARGTTQVITWDSYGYVGDYVKIDLLHDDVQVYQISASTVNSGSLSAIIPKETPIGTNYEIRITSTSDLQISDTSDSDFTIT